MTLSLPEAESILGWRRPEATRSTLHGLLIGVAGTFCILVAGLFLSFLTRPRRPI